MLQAYRHSHVTFLRSPLLDAVAGITHAFSTRRGAGADLDMAADGPASQDDRDRFMAAAGLGAWPVGRVRQIHSNRVHWVADNGFANRPPEGDAVCTTLPGMALGVTTADCVPILIADRQARAIAAVHAGWRGTSEGVARRTVDMLVARRGVEAGDLAAVIGPHIGACCMEVGEEVYAWFGQPEVFERRSDWVRPHLNLAEANRRQLAAAGLNPGNIQVSSLCTCCRRDLFHSYRRDGERAGRMMAVIGIQP